MEVLTLKQAVHLLCIGCAAHLKALFNEITLQQAAKAHIIIDNKYFGRFLTRDCFS